MNNLDNLNSSSKNLRRRCVPVTMWQWLTEPSSSILEPERRLQARLLITLLLILIIIGSVSLILSLFGVFSQEGVARTVGMKIQWITVTAILVMIVEYSLSRTEYYPLAAGLVVITLLSSTFLIAISNPGDHQFLYFLVLGGLVGSLFLSARVTAIIFAVTLLGLVLLSIFVVSIPFPYYLNVLFFILTVGGLVVMASILRQHYVEQIHWQTQVLVESEAKLRDLSIRDPLTRLFNRRFLEESLTLEMIRATRKQHSIGIIMVDIDHFKRINDIHGHAAGDFILVQMSKFLLKHIRSSDLICRIGGEEFILVLPEATRKITQLRAEQMWEDTKHLHIQYEGQTLEAVTISVGVAVFPEHGLTYDEILRAVDTALYRAKREGRDRVCVAN